MKAQLRKLNRLIKINCLNPDNFKVITVYGYAITFMGDYTPRLAIKLGELFGEGKTSTGSGFVEFAKYNITIILT